MNIQKEAIFGFLCVPADKRKKTQILTHSHERAEFFWNGFYTLTFIKLTPAFTHTRTVQNQGHSGAYHTVLIGSSVEEI